MADAPETTARTSHLSLLARGWWAIGGVVVLFVTILAGMTYWLDYVVPAKPEYQLAKKALVEEPVFKKELGKISMIEAAKGTRYFSSLSGPFQSEGHFTFRVVAEKRSGLVKLRWRYRESDQKLEIIEATLFDGTVPVFNVISR